MRSLSHALFLVALLAVPLLAGCKSPCRRLAEQLCECTTNSLERESCLRTVSNRESNVEVTAEQEALCETLIPRCDCRALDPSTPGNTPEGVAHAKRECGLAH
jgi:hypothetical protein